MAPRCPRKSPLGQPKVNGHGPLERQGDAAIFLPAVGPLRRSNPRDPHAPMRVAVLSRAYSDPANRGKLRALAGLGCQVAAIVPDEDSSGTVEWTDDGGVQVVPVRTSGDWGDPAGPEWSRRAIRRFLRDFRPDVIQIEEEPWTRAASRAHREARRIRVPTVAFTRQTVSWKLPARLALRRRRILRGAKGIVAANPLAMGLVGARYPDLRAIVLPQLGIAPPLAATRGSEAFVIGFVGRLVAEKGPDILLRAALKVIAPWRLRISGTGPDQEELEALASRLGIAARITWLGAQPRDDLERSWSALDCFVAPSRSTRTWAETDGLAVMTAMAHGLPVVVSPSGALPGVVGDTGVIVPEDDADALAAALQQLYEDRDRRRSLGAAARRRAMDIFSDTAVARRLLDFWRESTVSSPP